MRMAYFDGAAGAGGDMILAALVDAGARKTAVMRVLRKLSLGGCRVDFRGVKRGGFRALRATVRPPRGAAGAALARLRKGGTVRGVPHGILESGRAVLQKLFRAEGIVHGTRVKHVHLHELEDWDTVVDVFGTLAALEDLGVGRVYAGELVAGGGTVRTRHGELPAPAPGAAELLRGMKVTFAPGAGETVTPTAAAILGTLAERGAPPPMTLEAVGYGAGSRETPGRPNVTRVFIGSGTGKGERDDVVQLDAVVDDMNPQLTEAFMDRAYAEGALEAWVHHVAMKKGRPGLALTALARPEKAEAVCRAFLEETTTLGVRMARLARSVLPRDVRTVATRFGPVRVKFAGSGRAGHAVPEYDDMRRAARRARLPLRLVMAEVFGVLGRAGSPRKT